MGWDLIITEFRDVMRMGLRISLLRQAAASNSKARRILNMGARRGQWNTAHLDHTMDVTAREVMKGGVE